MILPFIDDCRQLSTKMIIANYLQATLKDKLRLDRSCLSNIFSLFSSVLLWGHGLCQCHSLGRNYLLSTLCAANTSFILLTRGRLSPFGLGQLFHETGAE